MPDLTPREIAENMLKRIDRPYSAHIIAVNDAEIELLRRIAAGEYKRVAHGRWVNMPFNVDNDKYGMNKYNMRIKCTNCGFVTSSELKYAHCPVCGALMDGKDDSHA